MKDIIISDNAAETIKLIEGDDAVALVHVSKIPEQNYKRQAIILNRRESLNLYRALQEIILGRVKT